MQDSTSRGDGVGALVLPRHLLKTFRDTLSDHSLLKKGIMITPFHAGSSIPVAAAPSTDHAHRRKTQSALAALHVSCVATVMLNAFYADDSDSLNVLPSSVRALLQAHSESVQWMPGLRVLSPACCKPPADNSSPPESSQHSFTFSELFAGIGGFRVALEKLGGKCVFTSEIDPKARALYERNFGPPPPPIMHPETGAVRYHRSVGDIFDVEATSIEKSHDLLTGGFPCQPFSTMGDCAGLQDPRGTLFREICRVLKGSKPRAFLLENVANLAFLEGGRTMDTIVSELKQCGYDVSWRLINVLSLLPQQRYRVYIVGIHHDQRVQTRLESSTTFEWPELPILPTTLEDVLCPEGTSEQEYDEDDSVPANENSRKRKGPPIDDDERWQLTATQFEKLQMNEEFRRNPNLRLARLTGPARTLMSSYRRGWALRSEFVWRRPRTSEHGSRRRPRFYTPRECASLQGFPRWFRLVDSTHSEQPKRKKLKASESGSSQSSSSDHDGRIYHQLGNAVSPPIVCAIASQILISLRQRPSGDGSTQGCAGDNPEKEGGGEEEEEGEGYGSKTPENDKSKMTSSLRRHRRVIAPALQLLLEAYPRPDAVRVATGRVGRSSAIDSQDRGSDEKDSSSRDAARKLEVSPLSSLVQSFLRGDDDCPAACTGRSVGLTSPQDLGTVVQLLRSGQPAAQISALSTIGRAVFLEQCERERNSSTPGASPVSESVLCILRAGILPLVCQCLPGVSSFSFTASTCNLPHLQEISNEEAVDALEFDEMKNLDNSKSDSTIRNRSTKTTTNRRSELQRLAVVALAIMSRQPGQLLRGCFLTSCAMTGGAPVENNDDHRRSEAENGNSPRIFSNPGRWAKGNWQMLAINALSEISSDVSDVSTARQASEILRNTRAKEQEDYESKKAAIH